MSNPRRSRMRRAEQQVVKAAFKRQRQRYLAEREERDRRDEQSKVIIDQLLADGMIKPNAEGGYDTAVEPEVWNAYMEQAKREAEEQAKQP